MEQWEESVEHGGRNQWDSERSQRDMKGGVSETGWQEQIRHGSKGSRIETK